jgi:hypothetical protein
MGKMFEQTLFREHTDLRDFIFDTVNKKNPMIRWAHKLGMAKEFRKLRAELREKKLEQKLKPSTVTGSFEEYADDAFDSDEEVMRILSNHGLKLGGGRQLPGVHRLIDVELLEEE